MDLISPAGGVRPCAREPSSSLEKRTHDREACSQVWPNRTVQPSKVDEAIEDQRLLRTVSSLLIKTAGLRGGVRGNQREVVLIQHPVDLDREVLSDMNPAEDIQRRTVLRVVERYRRIGAFRQCLRDHRDRG